MKLCKTIIKLFKILQNIDIEKFELIMKKFLKFSVNFKYDVNVKKVK